MNKPLVEPGIVTNDAPTLADFYRHGLGFTVDRVLELPQGEIYRLSRGEALVKFFQPADRAATSSAESSWAATTGWSYAALHVDDAAAESARAEAAGATILVPLTNHRPGAHFVLLTDPEGNVWELLQEDEPPA